MSMAQNKGTHMRKRNFKALLENNRWLKAIPNFLTICNSLCGFAAILYALHMYDGSMYYYHPLKVSAWIIMFAMVFDALDGFAARIFNAASMKGLQMDSLADMVTFGVAPSVIVAVLAHSLRQSDQMYSPYEYLLVWGVSGVYLGCAALRLATYNVSAMFPKKNYDSNYFSGLPSPGAAAAICSAVIFFSDFTGEYKNLTYGLPLYAATLGLLMVSSIKYVHVGRWLLSVRRNKRRLFMLFVVLASAAYQPDATLIVVVNLYIFSGPLMTLLNKFGIVKAKPEEVKELQTDSQLQR